MHVDGLTADATLLSGRNWVVITFSNGVLKSLLICSVKIQAHLVNFVNILNISTENLSNEYLKKEKYLIIKGVKLMDLEENFAIFFCFKESIMMVSILL